MDTFWLLHGVFASVLIATFWVWFSGTIWLRHIPTLGTSLPIFAYLDGLKFRSNGKKRIQEAYRKYSSRGGICKVAMTDQWLVLLSDPAMVDELRKMPDDVASLRHGLAERTAIGYTLGHVYIQDPMHANLVRERLAHEFGNKFDSVREEIWAGFESEVGLPEEWRPVKALAAMTRIVTRTTNRIYVGTPLCHDQTFLSLIDKFRAESVSPRFTINLVPHPLKPFIASIVKSRLSGIRPVHIMLSPILRDRRAQLDNHLRSKTPWPDKPDDVLMWLLEEAVRKGYPDEIVTLFFLVAEVPAIGTTSSGFVQALYRLAADPSLANPLREEAEAVLSEDGGQWRRSTVHKLYRMDSFLKECQRLDSNFTATVVRKALRPITFSNGTTLPRGTLVSAASTGFHMDDALYEDPEVFKPWRFVNSKALVATSGDYLPFGHGRQACPGRHLAAAQMKLMMAYVVMHYDVALQNEEHATGPRSDLSGHTVRADPAANVMFRKRP